MFKKILIANRGEIACRVIKTARRMGIKTVAVYSAADLNAVHVELADEAIPIGPPPASDSYLAIDKIIDAAKNTKAQAIHPGYGFLSENAAFAKALAKAGIVFIGPNVKAIEVMGDKIESKKFAAKAKVNTVPGHIGVINDAKEAAKIAGEIGYPVMIKASAGGGGKGMRIAYSEKEVADGFASSRSEAKSSFGDDRIFIEKFIEEPRHIEIQVLADGQGNVIHMGERECSIQRRNQKVLEEAPSPFVDEELRAEMGAQAVALAKAVDYASAGTVEFIADKNRNFYFLEMNTRLQVEHPVTELVTGIDLVEQMIRVAAGEKLKPKQADVSLTGWAIESRVYAEDPFRNFLPSTGRLTAYRPPEEGTTAAGLTIRNDTGVSEGSEISLYYDPMIAKLITHGPTRDAAIDHMIRALDAFYIDGIQHNIPFLSAIMSHKRWRKGDLSTAFIAEEYPDGFSSRVPTSEERVTLAVVAAAIDHLSNQRRREISHQMVPESFSFSDTRIVQLGDHIQKVIVSGGLGQDVEVVFVDKSSKEHDRTTVSSDWWFGSPVWSGRLNGVEVAVQVRSILNGFDLSYRGVHLPAYVYTQREAELAALMPVKESPDTSKQLLCPMPGLVVALHVEEGQQVKAGEALCVVEAMKMENILRAERDVTVAEVLAKPGDSLAVDATIMTFE
jgi:propionyl-CoA carboxylase alpha chain